MARLQPPKKKKGTPEGRNLFWKYRQLAISWGHPRKKLLGSRSNVSGRMLLFHRHSKPRNFKCWEFDVDLWSFERGIHWLIITIETRRRQDHPGFYFTAVLVNFKIEWNRYDVRHWNQKTNHYYLESEYESP